MKLIRNAVALLSLFVIVLALTHRAHSAEPPFDSVNWNTWSWTAPDPPLPNTTWYDYGEGSTSNGPTPATALAIAGFQRAPTTAPLPKSEAKSWVNSLSVSPYATVAFEDFDGGATGGVGLDVGIGISKAVSLVAFGESDDIEGSFVDRAGLGLRVTGRVTRALSLFGQMSGGYSFSDSAGLKREEWFIRPQFGGTLDFWRYRDWHAGVTASWALDVDLDGHTAQRLFGGLAVGTSF